MAATAVGYAAEKAHLWHSFELRTVDWRFQHRADQPVPSDVVVVALDKPSIRELAAHFHRPVPGPKDDLGLPRRVHATVINFLHDAHAKAIGYDILFAGRSDSRRDDRALLGALKRAHPVALPVLNARVVPRPPVNGRVVNDY